MSTASARARPAPDAASVFAALGDVTRLGLVARLSAGGPLSITRLSDGSAVTRQAVTKHLHVLAGAGLVRHARRGRERIWELDSRRLEEARRFLDHVSGQWDAALDRLRAFVEDPLPLATKGMPPHRAKRRRKRSIPTTR
jgi:DNA-binding transcriptional ArsR family regulator